MKKKQYVLFEGAGRKVRGYRYGKPVEVRYFDIIRTDIAAPNRDDFIALVEDQRFTNDELGQIRIGYVDDEGVGKYYNWWGFMDLQPQTA